MICSLKKSKDPNNDQRRRTNEEEVLVLVGVVGVGPALGLSAGRGCERVEGGLAGLLAWERVRNELFELVMLINSKTKISSTSDSGEEGTSWREEWKGEECQVEMRREVKLRNNGRSLENLLMKGR